MILVNLSKDKREAIAIATLLLFSFLIKILLVPLPGYEVDLTTFTAWFKTAAEFGPRVFYNVVPWCDYPPFNVYLFWLFGSLAKGFSLFNTSYSVYLVKLPPILFDTATTFLIFWFVRRRLNFKISIIAASLYAFNPAIIFNIAVWGQYDAIYTFFLVLSLMFLIDSKLALSAASFAVGILTKPQSIALAPLLVFLILRKRNWRGLASSILVGISALIVLIIPFEWSNPIKFLSSIYFGALEGYAYTTVNAFNLWALGGLFRPDTQSFLFVDLFTIGWILFGALTVFTLYFLHKRVDDKGDLIILFSAFVLLFGFFLLPTRIHERYMFPAIAILTLMVPFLKKIRLVFAALSFTFLVNQAYVLLFLNKGQFIQFNDPVVWIVTLINLSVFLYVLMLMFNELRHKTGVFPKPI
ncbi:glycosyltransferase family 39 protein [Candidatus Bathyarchaeota archaeon]|nr:glycosyltransferase family 39 protein [Candidatus Bathyarchaeota archaeon]